MIPFQTKAFVPSGSSYHDVIHYARAEFTVVAKRTKRQPYLRSAYFKKEKIFLNYFWPHLLQKSMSERARRLKLVGCAFELIEQSQNKPTVRLNPNNKNEKMYRFLGLTPNKHVFYVQIKENLKTKKKYFMSVFFDK